MAEYVRSVTVRIEIDTNKQTYVYEADEYDPSEIAEWVAERMS